MILNLRHVRSLHSRLNGVLPQGVNMLSISPPGVEVSTLAAYAHMDFAGM